MNFTLVVGFVYECKGLETGETIADVLVDLEMDRLRRKTEELNLGTLGMTGPTKKPFEDLRNLKKEDIRSRLGAIADCLIAKPKLISLGDVVLLQGIRGMYPAQIESIRGGFVSGPWGGIRLELTMVVPKDGRGVLCGREFAKHLYPNPVEVTK